MQKKIKQESYEIIISKQSISKVIKWLKDFCIKHKITKTITQQIMVATDEAITNIALYSYKQNSSGIVQINFKILNNEIIINIVNFGIPFKPGKIIKKKNDDINKIIPGGYGLILINSLMDKVEFSYNKSNLSNCLNMRKKLFQGEYIL